MTEYFYLLNTQLIGYGNPIGKYWFGGIEGAEGFSGEDNIKEYCEKINGRKYIPDEPCSFSKVRQEKGSRFTKIYDAMAKIVLMHRNGKTEVGPDEVNCFLYKELFVKSGDTFQINLYPLGKPRVRSWNENYNKWFGLKNKAEYFSKVKEDRFQEIRKFAKQYNRPERLIVCFGTSYKNEYMEAFGTDLLVPSGKPTTIYHDQNHRLLVVPFPAYGHLTNQGIEDAVQVMREFWI